MRPRRPSLSTRGILAVGLLVGLTLGGWVEWTGRRARAIRWYRIEWEDEHDLSGRIEFFRDEIRRSEVDRGSPGPLAEFAAKLKISLADLEAATQAEMTAEDGRLLAEHEAEVARGAPMKHGPIAGLESISPVISYYEMVEPGWLKRTLRREAEHRRLRQRYEYAINRPWVAVPKGPAAGGD